MTDRSMRASSLAHGGAGIDEGAAAAAATDDITAAAAAAAAASTPNSGGYEPPVMAHNALGAAGGASAIIYAIPLADDEVGASGTPFIHINRAFNIDGEKPRGRLSNQPHGMVPGHHGTTGVAQQNAPAMLYDVAQHAGSGNAAPQSAEYSHLAPHGGGAGGGERNNMYDLGPQQHGGGGGGGGGERNNMYDLGPQQRGGGGVGSGGGTHGGFLTSNQNGIEYATIDESGGTNASSYSAIAPEVAAPAMLYDVAQHPGSGNVAPQSAEYSHLAPHGGNAQAMLYDVAQHPGSGNAAPQSANYSHLAPHGGGAVGGERNNMYDLGPQQRGGGVGGRGGGAMYEEPDAGAFC